MFLKNKLGKGGVLKIIMILIAVVAIAFILIMCALMVGASRGNRRSTDDEAQMQAINEMRRGKKQRPDKQ